MRTRLTMFAAAFSLVLGSAVAAGSQGPPITNANLTTQRAGTPLRESFAALVNARAETGWIGYSVPMLADGRSMCCGGSGNHVSGSMSEAGNCCATCRLERASEPAAQRSTRSETSTGPVPLEPSDRMNVLFRAVDRRVERIRVFSHDCELDAGSRPVIWLENVSPAESIVLLESMVQTQGGRERVADGAIAAIALHRDPAADASLGRLAATNQPEPIRKKVTFWLGHARGAQGLELLRRILREDASLAVRKSAVFGLSQSAAPTAVEELLATARSHSEPAVRGEAIFWLGQKAGARAAAAITGSIEQDPDTEVKKRAVFALSQFPRDEGIPLLIEVARRNTNPAVRKQAMFWLAQSRDPRAIEFFAEILK